MNNKKLLDEATKYLRKYKGIEDYILKHGTTYPVSSIITYLYKYRILESFGYDLEDIFMEVYLQIWNMPTNNESLQNVPRFIKRKIMDYIKDDFINTSQRKLMRLNIEDFQFLEIRSEEYDLGKEEIDNTFESFIENFTDRDVIDYMLNKAHLSNIEKKILIKYFHDGKTVTQLSNEFNYSKTYISHILQKALCKIRSRFWNKKNDILYPRE